MREIGSKRDTIFRRKVSWIFFRNETFEDTDNSFRINQFYTETGRLHSFLLLPPLNLLLIKSWNDDRSIQHARRCWQSNLFLLFDRQGAVLSKGKARKSEKAGNRACKEEAQRGWERSYGNARGQVRGTGDEECFLSHNAWNEETRCA